MATATPYPQFKTPYGLVEAQFIGVSNGQDTYKVYNAVHDEYYGILALPKASKLNVGVITNHVNQFHKSKSFNQ